MTSSCRVAVGDASTSPGRWHAALGSRKRHRHAGGVFVPRRAPRGGPPADPGILVVRSRVRGRLSLPSEPRELWRTRRRPGTACGTPPRRRRRCAATTPASRGTRPRCSPRTSRPGGPCVLDVGWPGPTGPRGAGRSCFGGNPDSNAFVPTSRCLDLCAPRDDAAADDGSVDDADVFAEKRKEDTLRDDGYGPREAVGLSRWRAIRTTGRRVRSRERREACGGVSAARLGGVTCRDRRWWLVLRRRSRVAAFQSVSGASDARRRRPPPATWRPAARSLRDARARSTRMRRWDARSSYRTIRSIRNRDPTIR